jgi:hypothetical protein
LGSGLAGAKAGILGGIFLGAAIGISNILLLEAFSSDVLQFLAGNAALCPATATPQDCLSTTLLFSIPTFVMFPVAVFGVIFGSLFGLYFEYLPGVGYRMRGLSMGLGLLVFILFFGVGGETIPGTTKAVMSALDLLLVVAYTLIISRFYRKFTREVAFQSARPKDLKVLVDERNSTGKTKTFALNSTHKVKADDDGKGFKEWLVSGGVSVDDPKSFETTFKVEGDGLLKVS